MYSFRKGPWFFDTLKQFSSSKNSWAHKWPNLFVRPNRLEYKAHHLLTYHWYLIKQVNFMMNKAIGCKVYDSFSVLDQIRKIFWIKKICSDLNIFLFVCFNLKPVALRFFFCDSPSSLSIQNLNESLLKGELTLFIFKVHNQSFLLFLNLLIQFLRQVLRQVFKQSVIQCLSPHLSCLSKTVCFSQTTNLTDYC